MISIIKFSVQFFLSENYNLDSVNSNQGPYTLPWPGVWLQLWPLSAQPAITA